jgi:hypothetical protein
MILIPKLTSVLVVVLLVACATPAEMRTKNPALVIDSALPAKTVAICIANKWEESGFLGLTMPVRMRPTSTGYTISITDAYNRTSFVADVDSNQSMTTTRLYRAMDFGGGDIIDAVKNCQK